MPVARLHLSWWVIRRGFDLGPVGRAGSGDLLEFWPGAGVQGCGGAWKRVRGATLDERRCSGEVTGLPRISSLVLRAPHDSHRLRYDVGAVLRAAEAGVWSPVTVLIVAPSLKAPIERRSE